MPKALICDLPYPSVENLKTDIVSGQIISFAYASLHSELTAILQYSYHALHFDGIKKEYADTMESIAIAEMMHLKLLGGAMLKLGVNPVYTQTPNKPIWFNTSTVSRATMPKKMIMDDLQGELNAIADYRKMLFVLRNEEVAALIERIILDEQLHVEALKNILAELNCKAD